MGKDMKTDNGIKWTDQQAHVIDTRHGNLLVSAAAGAGKTAAYHRDGGRKKFAW